MKKRNKEQGFILMTSAIIMISLLLLVMPFLFKLSSEYKHTEKSHKSFAALSLAEAGIERAIWELNYGDISTWQEGDPWRTMTISDFQASTGSVLGDIEIWVEEPNGANTVVESTGTVAYSGNLTISKTIRVILDRECAPWDYGVFGNEGVELSSGAEMDSYDSRLGDYGDSNNGSEANVGTNDTLEESIRLTLGTQVHGDAFSGESSNPEEAIYVSPTSNLHGEKLALSKPKELPSVPSPEGLDFRGELIVTSETPMTISESGEYINFELDMSSQVTIMNDISLYVSGDFIMGDFSKLDIDPSASVKIYLGGNFIQGFATEINNNTNDPTRLLILGTDSLNGNISISLASDFYGAIYAPRASLECSFWGDLYGSIVAKIIQIQDASNIHYDKAFEDYKVEGLIGSEHSVKSWKEKLIH